MSIKWEVVNIDDFKDNQRITLRLSKKYLIKLRKICDIFKVKQYSKAVKILIDLYSESKNLG